MNILILLLIWSNLVAICMAGCAITPDSNGHVTIPDDWSGLVNGAIPSHAFVSCSTLKSVTIGGSVTSIGNDAFESCSALQSVTIPDSVTTIGQRAFQTSKSYHSDPIDNIVTRIRNINSLKTKRC